MRKFCNAQCSVLIKYDDNWYAKTRPSITMNLNNSATILTLKKKKNYRPQSGYAIVCYNSLLTRLDEFLRNHNHEHRNAALRRTHKYRFSIISISE